MKIIIADHEYIYSYIGETIPRPTMSTFVINEDDISEFHKYYWDIAAYDRKKEKLVEICSSVICIAIYIAEIAYLLICKENLESYDFIIAFIGLFLGCLIPAFIQAALLHALIIGPLLKKIIAKMVKGHPIKPDKWANVRDYENACKNFENTTTKWQSKFPGIQDVNYDLSAYGVNCLNSTIEELAAFTNSQNEIIRKDVLRQYQQYWFDLDPFDFEGQFIDRGESYTTAIFYKNNSQKILASNYIKDIELKFNKPVATKILKETKFYMAEEYHQDFAINNKEEMEEELIVSGRKQRSQ